MNATVERVKALAEQCEFENYTFHVTVDREGAKLQATYPEADIVTGDMETQYTRKWLISPHATDSEIVRTIFKCCETSVEHRLREHFKFRNKRIFGPHFDVYELVKIANKVDVRAA